MAGRQAGGLQEGAAGASSFNLFPAGSLEAKVKGALINCPVDAALGARATSPAGRGKARCKKPSRESGRLQDAVRVAERH